MSCLNLEEQVIVKGPQDITCLDKSNLNHTTQTGKSQDLTLVLC